MRRLVAGAWVGEFGWEIMSWQGFVRKAALKYDEVIVCSGPGSEALYSDFAHKYITHNIEGIRDCWYIRPTNSELVSRVFSHLKSLGGDLLMPSRYIPIDRQKFIHYGRPNQMPHYDVIFHARKPVGKWPGRAWPQKQWDDLSRRLKAAGLRCACIGTEAYVPAEAINLTSLTLQEVMDLIAAATMVTGPSSGPMPLASLCGTPHLVWSDKKVYVAIGCNNRQRFEKVWNPFGTACKVLDDYAWQPPVDVVATEIVRCFDQWKLLPRRSCSVTLPISGVSAL